MSDKLFSELSKGTYSGATAYTVGDFVDYNGSSYACIANSTGNLPTDTDFWALLAEKGDTGDTGAQGEQGIQGEQGEQGIQGEQGDIGITWQGAWSAGTYQINDGVEHNGSSWIATAITTEEPSGSATDWDLVALKGEDGTGSGDVSKVGTPVDNQIGVWTGDGTLEGTSGLTYDGTNLLVTGSLGSTGARLTKAWLTDLEVTNAIVGSIAGNAATVTTNANLTGHITSTGNATVLGSFTIAQLNTAVSDATLTTLTGSETLTTKRIQPRSSTAASGDITPALATANIWQRTALSAGITINAPTGTPVLGEVLVFMLLDNGTSRALTWNSAFTTREMSEALPTSTTISKQLLVTCQYNGSTWLCLSSEEI